MIFFQSGPTFYEEDTQRDTLSGSECTTTETQGTSSQAEQQCRICMDSLNNAEPNMSTTCGHTFHEACLNESLQVGLLCNHVLSLTYSIQDETLGEMN